MRWCIKLYILMQEDAYWPHSLLADVTSQGNTLHPTQVDKQDRKRRRQTDANSAARTHPILR